MEGGIKAPLTAIKELNKGISDEEAEEELLQIFASKGVETIDEGGNGDETDSAEPAEGSEEEREDDPTENSAP